MQKLLFLLIPFILLANDLTLDDLKEIKLGDIAYKDLLKHSKISHNKDEVDAINRVGSKIAKATGKNYDWKFTLIDNNSINAFCLPGGKVIVYRGLFKVVKNDDQLATVLGHEIAHALLKHGSLKMKLNSILSIPKDISKNLFGQFVPKELHPLLDDIYDTGKNLIIIKPYSRENELEADKLGIDLMYKAGYNPDEAIKLWNNMKNIESDKIPEFLSTHPDIDNRIKIIKDEIAKLKRDKR